MKKAKSLIALLVVILVFSTAFTFMQFLQGNDDNKGSSQMFFVSGASVSPNITQIQFGRDGDRFQTSVRGDFQNNEKVDVYGVATATVKVSNTESHTQQSNRTLIPAGQSVWIEVLFKGLPYENFYACYIVFKAEPISAPAGGGSSTSGGGSHTAGPTHSTGTSSSGGFDFASVGLAVVGVVVIAFCAVAGFMVIKKTRVSEQKVKRFTSYEYQDWVMQRLGARAGSVLDSRKGIDAFTNANVPLMIKQSDNVGRLQVDSFMNALTQAKVRSGVLVAFGYDSDAFAAVSRAKMNRIDIRLVTVKELIDHKDTILV